MTHPKLEVQAPYYVRTHLHLSPKRPMRHTGAAVRVTDAKVDLIVCPPEVFQIILENTYDVTCDDGWYAYVLAEGDSEGTMLVPIDSLPVAE